MSREPWQLSPEEERKIWGFVDRIVFIIAMLAVALAASAIISYIKQFICW